MERDTGIGQKGIGGGEGAGVGEGWGVVFFTYRSHESVDMSAKLFFNQPWVLNATQLESAEQAVSSSAIVQSALQGSWEISSFSASMLEYFHQ